MNRSAAADEYDEIDELKARLKHLLVKELSVEGVDPEKIDDDLPLFGEAGLGLDSLDAVEIVVLLQRHFRVEVEDIDQAREIFASVRTLASYIARTRQN